MACRFSAAVVDVAIYFNANFPQGYLGSSVDGPNITASKDNEILTLTAWATVNTSFAHFLGHDTITVSAMTGVTRRTNLLDLVLAMDMSGSMAWDDGTGN